MRNKESVKKARRLRRQNRPSDLNTKELRNLQRVRDEELRRRHWKKPAE